MTSHTMSSSDPIRIATPKVHVRRVAYLMAAA
jgi:hypothetical protein